MEYCGRSARSSVGAGRADVVVVFMVFPFVVISAPYRRGLTSPPRAEAWSPITRSGDTRSGCSFKVSAGVSRDQGVSRRPEVRAAPVIERVSRVALRRPGEKNPLHAQDRPDRR